MRMPCASGIAEGAAPPREVVDPLVHIVAR
jgi:hypothetical protein